MQYIFTAHAEFRIEKRKLTREEVIESIKSPDKTLKKHNKYFIQKNIGRGTIEIAVEKTERYIKIITVYWL